MVEHKFLLFSYQIHLNHQYLPEMRVKIMMQSEVTVSTDFQTPNLVGSTNGKGSQIRRSMWTIGKLINGSENS